MTTGASDVDIDAEIRIVRGVADVDDLDRFLAEIDAIRETTGAVVQVVDARYVVSRRHLERAVELAERAIARGENVARDRAVEVLLYTAGRRQIDDALELGVDEGETPAVAVAYAPDGADDVDLDATVARLRKLLETDLGTGDGVGDDAPYDPDQDRVVECFDVNEAELSATAGDLADIVLERVALLDVQK